MTTPPEKLTVECPQCFAVYGDWFRASMNLMLDDFDGDYIAEASSATCPTCGHRVDLDVLIIEEDGVWRSRDAGMETD